MESIYLCMKNSIDRAEIILVLVCIFFGILLFKVNDFFETAKTSIIRIAKNYILQSQ